MKIVKIQQHQKQQQFKGARLKVAEVTILEGAKVAASVAVSSRIGSSPMVIYPALKVFGDIVETTLRSSLVSFLKFKTKEKSEKIMFGNPANSMTNLILLSSGNKRFLETIKGLFK